MIPRTRVTAVILAGGLLLGAAGAVQAQPPGQGLGQGQGQSLSSLLHLRADQQGAYQAYQAATKPTQGEVSQMRSMSPQVIASLTTPQRLDRIATYLQLQQQRFQRSASATRAFYAQLTPAQQRTYDQVTAPAAQGQGAPPR